MSIARKFVVHPDVEEQCHASVIRIFFLWEWKGNRFQSDLISNHVGDISATLASRFIRLHAVAVIGLRGQFGISFSFSVLQAPAQSHDVFTQRCLLPPHPALQQAARHFWIYLPRRHPDCDTVRFHALYLRTMSVSRASASRCIGELTIGDGTRREDGLFPLAQAGVYALVDQHLSDRPLILFPLSLCRQLLLRLDETFVVIARVVDVAHLVPRLGLVDRAEPPGAQKAGLEEFGRGREVARVLLVAEIARLDQDWSLSLFSRCHCGGCCGHRRRGYGWCGGDR